MEEQQKELEEKEFTASVGGGVVKVTVSGKREVTNVELAEEAVDPDDDRDTAGSDRSSCK